MSAPSAWREREREREHRERERERDEREQRERDAKAEREQRERERERAERERVKQQNTRNEKRAVLAKHDGAHQPLEVASDRALVTSNTIPHDAAHARIPARHERGDATAGKEQTKGGQSTKERAQERMRDLQTQFNLAYSSPKTKDKSTAFVLVIIYDQLEGALKSENEDDIKSILDGPPLDSKTVTDLLKNAYDTMQAEARKLVDDAEASIKATNIYGADADVVLLQRARDAKTSLDALLTPVTETMRNFQNANSADKVRELLADLEKPGLAKRKLQTLSGQVGDEEGKAHRKYIESTNELFESMRAIKAKNYGPEDFWTVSTTGTLQQRAMHVHDTFRKAAWNSNMPLHERAELLVQCARDAAAIKTEVDAAIEEEEKKKHAPGSLDSLKAKIDKLFATGQRDLAVSATVMYVLFEDKNHDDVSDYVNSITKAESGTVLERTQIQQAKDRLTGIQEDIVRDGKGNLEELNRDLSGISLPPNVTQRIAEALATVEVHSGLVEYCYGIDGDTFDWVYGTIKTYRLQAQEAAITAQQLRPLVQQAQAAAAVPRARAKALRVARKSTASDEIALLKKLPFPCANWLVNARDAGAGNVFALFADRVSGSDGDIVANVQADVQLITNTDNFKSSGKNPTCLVVINAITTDIEVPTEVTVTFGSREVTLKTHRTQRNVALVYAPDYDVLVDEDGEFFACTLIPAQPIVADSKEIKREDYCAGTSGKRLRAESMYLCHRKVLAFALDERQKQAKRMSNKISGHEIDGDFDRVFVTSDIHADLRKFVQILLACGLITIGTHTHDHIYENETNIYEIVWEARWVAKRTLLVICGDLIDSGWGPTDEQTSDSDHLRDVRGSYEFLLHCLLFNLRIQARHETRGSDVRFTIGNHDAGTVTACGEDGLKNIHPGYVEDRHVSFASGGNPSVLKRRNMLLPFYACSPYIMLTMRAIAFVHAGFVDNSGADIYADALERQNRLNNTHLQKTETQDLLDFFKPTQGGEAKVKELWTRAYAGDTPCTASTAYDKYKLIAVGHCVTHTQRNLKALIAAQCADTPEKHGCVLTQDCRTTGGPLIALVDTGMSAAFRATKADRVTENGKRHVGMLMLHKHEQSGESLGIVSGYNVYRIRAMSGISLLQKNGHMRGTLVIGESTVEVTYTHNGTIDAINPGRLEYWASPWKESPRFAPFPHAYGIRSTTGLKHRIVEIHNNANGNCLLEALGFYLCASQNWQGKVDDLRGVLLSDVKKRADVDVPDRNRVKAAIFTDDESAVWEKEAQSKLGGDQRVAKYIFIHSRPGAYLGELEIDAFARVFKRTVCLWSTDEKNKVFKTYCSDSSYVVEPPIANFDSFVHLRYYDRGIEEADRNKGHFTLLALLVPTQPTQAVASSFGRKRARLYV